MSIKIDDIQVFKYVKNHLLKQNEKSQNGDTCRYLTVGSQTESEILDDINKTYTNEYVQKLYDDEINTIEKDGRVYYLGDYVDSFTYDQVVCHKLRSEMFNNSLEYHLKNSNKQNRSCAVGCLISKEEYHVGLENKSIFDTDIIGAVKSSNPQWGLGKRQVQMLKILQTIHDTTEPNQWSIYFNFIEQYDFFKEDKDGVMSFDPENYESKLQPLTSAEKRKFSEMLREATSVDLKFIGY